MSHTLIINQGDPRTEEGDSGSYKKVAYYFPGQKGTIKTSFVGWALLQFLDRTEQDRVDQLVILGTPTSCWQAWLEADQLLGDDVDEALVEEVVGLHDELSQVTGRGNPGGTVEQLERLADLLTDALEVKVRCEAVPEDGDTKAQQALFEVLGNVLSPGDRVSLDITHGFRYLSVFELLSIALTNFTDGVRLAGVYYGKFPSGEIMRLDAVQDALRWKTGLEGVAQGLGVRGLLELPEVKGASGGRLARALGAFDLRMGSLQIAEAINAAGEIKAAWREARIPMGSLFEKQIASLWSWVVSKDAILSGIALAGRMAAHGDYLRASVLAYESMLRKVCKNAGKNYDDYQVQKACEDEWLDAFPAVEKGMLSLQDIHWLRSWRNERAHGGGRKVTLEQLAKDREKFHRILKKIELFANP